MHIEYWYACPKCGHPKLFKYFTNTKIEKLPAYCKKCKRETIITMKPKRLNAKH